MPQLDLTGVVAALGSAGSWAIGSFLFKALGEVLSPLAMTLAKGVCSLVLLGTMMVLFRSDLESVDSLALLAVSGFIGIAVGDTLFFEALNRLGPQPLLVLAVLGQVLTVLVAFVLLHESPSPGAWIGVILVIFGVAVVMRAKLAEESRQTGLCGLIFGLLSVFCMTASSIIAKSALNDSSDTLQASFVRMFAGTLGVFVFGLTTKQLTAWVLPLRDLRLLLLFVFSVAVVTFGGFWLSMVAFKRIPVSIASCLTSTEPVFGLIIAAALFREKLTLKVAGGTLATFLGVVFICVPGIDSLIVKTLSFTPLGG